MYYNVQPYTSAGFISSAVVKTGKTRLHWVFPYNQNAAVRFIQVFDAAAVPADTAVPLWAFPLGATSAPQKELAFPPDGLLCNTGLVIVLSTTISTKTIAGADLLVTLGYS